MKTTTKFMYVFMLAFAFVSCTSDDDSGGDSQYTLDDIQGKWYRAYSNNPNADGMEVTVINDYGSVTDPAGANFSLDDTKWKDIIATGMKKYEHLELGSDGAYYNASMELGQDDTLRVYVGHTGAGNEQKWVRTYTEPVISELNECMPYDADTFSNSLTSNWSEPNEKDIYPGLLPAVSDPAGGYYVVTVTTEESTTWIDIKNSGDSYTVINGSNGTTDDNIRKVAFSAEPGMSYDVSVNPFFNGPTSNFPETYTIQWEYHGIMDCYEPNNTFAEAKFIPKGETIEAFANLNNEGYGVQENHKDFYKIVLTESVKIQIELEQSPSDAFIDIRPFRYDESGLSASYNYISGDWAQNGGLYILTTNVLEPGIYYIRANSYWGGTLKVNLDQEGATLPDVWLTPYKFKVTAVQE